MFCKYCGNEISDDALFCSKCGSRLAAEKTATPAESAPTEQTQPLPQSAANSEKAAVDSAQIEAISETTDTAQSDSDTSTAQKNAAQTEAAAQENGAHADGDAGKQPLSAESAMSNVTKRKQSKPKRKQKTKRLVIIAVVVAAALAVGIPSFLYFSDPYNRVLLFGTAQEQYDAAITIKEYIWASRYTFSISSRAQRMRDEGYPYGSRAGLSILELLEKALDALDKSNYSYYYRDIQKQGDVLSELGDLYELGSVYGIREDEDLADSYYRQAIASWQQAAQQALEIQDWRLPILPADCFYTMNANDNPLVRIGDLYIEKFHDSETSRSYYDQAIDYYTQLEDKLFERSLDGNSPRHNWDMIRSMAKEAIGDIYCNKLFIYGLGIIYYESAINTNDNSSAKIKRGDAYLFGMGIRTPDYEAALALYTEAAEGHHLSAYSRIGYMWENGLGVPRSLSRARTYYEIAADSGNAAAQTALDRLDLWSIN